MSRAVHNRRDVLWLSLAMVLLVSAPSPPTPASAETSTLDAHHVTIARKLISNHFCPCGCGRNLPGSTSGPACFGCSVGKAEVTFILESLAAGMKLSEIIMQLNEPVLVDVFADYTDEELPKTWERARRVADELQQHRVVLRTPGRSEEARRAVAIAECARENGRFARVQDLLIRHQGPWEDGTLLALAGRGGLDPEAARECIDQIQISQQITKDRDHAALRKIEAFPAISVNGEVTPNTDEALRSAIRRVLLKKSA